MVRPERLMDGKAYPRHRKRDIAPFVVAAPLSLAFGRGGPGSSGAPRSTSSGAPRSTSS